jgi:hypothetical protein
MNELISTKELPSDVTLEMREVLEEYMTRKIGRLASVEFEYREGGRVVANFTPDIPNSQADLTIYAFKQDWSAGHVRRS